MLQLYTPFGGISNTSLYISCNGNSTRANVILSSVYELEQAVSVKLVGSLKCRQLHKPGKSSHWKCAGFITELPLCFYLNFQDVLSPVLIRLSSFLEEKLFWIFALDLQLALILKWLAYSMPDLWKACCVNSSKFTAFVNKLPTFFYIHQNGMDCYNLTPFHTVFDQWLHYMHVLLTARIYHSQNYISFITVTWQSYYAWSK